MAGICHWAQHNSSSGFAIFLIDGGRYPIGLQSQARLGITKPGLQSQARLGVCRTLGEGIWRRGWQLVRGADIPGRPKMPGSAAWQRSVAR